uniref:T-cell receptor alpha chain constant domain-containing protein n=1 Tax=Equus asinus asinus TaxID=83772 RepID=A0A8C4LUM0_EQUAS
MGIYYSVNTGYNQLTFGKGTMLLVSPDITDPKPSVYQLRNPKSSDTSICLFTDFNSEDKGNFRKEGVFFFNSTTLDMKVMNFKSNGMLAWSKTSDFTCNDTFNEIKFYSSSSECSLVVSSLPETSLCPGPKSIVSKSCSDSQLHQLPAKPLLVTDHQAPPSLKATECRRQKADEAQAAGKCIGP